MARKQINSVITALRPLQVDLSELTSEINNLWTHLRTINRTRLEQREQIATITRLNLTDSIEKLQVSMNFNLAKSNFRLFCPRFQHTFLPFNPHSLYQNQ
jgi:hypothetical protein